MTLKFSKKSTSSHRDKIRNKNNVNRTKKKGYHPQQGGSATSGSPSDGSVSDGSVSDDSVSDKLTKELTNLIDFFPDTTFSLRKYAESLIEKFKQKDEHSSITFKKYIPLLPISRFGKALVDINQHNINFSIETATKYFNNFDNFDTGLHKSKILYCNTHSGLPHPIDVIPYALVPPNIMVCFVNPIQHFGISRDTTLFTDIPSGEFENRKDLFKQLFTSAQKTNSQTLNYHSNSFTDSVKGISNLKLGSWYYPGELAPNVILSFEAEEKTNFKRLNVTQISYPREGSSEYFGIEEDTDCAEQIRSKARYSSNLFQFFLRYQNPNFRYIILVKGCRSMPYFNLKSGNQFNSSFYQEMMERELYYSALNRNLNIFKELTETQKNLAQHYPLSYYSSISSYFTSDILFEEMDKTLVDNIYLNFKNLHLISRFNPIYLEIFQNSKIRLLTDDEIKFIQMNSNTKLLLFLLKMCKEANFESTYFLKINVEEILYKQNLVNMAFSRVSNMYDYIYKLYTKDSLHIEHPVISQYLLDLVLTQSENIEKLSKFIQISIPVKIISKLFLTDENYKKINTLNPEQKFLFQNVTHFILENQQNFPHDYSINFPSLINLHIKNLNITQLYYTSKLHKIKFLKLDIIHLSSSQNLISFLSQFPNLKELKIVFSIMSQTCEILDLNELSSFIHLKKLSLENINKVRMLRIQNDNLKILSIEQQDSPEHSFTILADLNDIKDIDLKVGNLNTEISYIKGNKQLDSYKYESTTDDSRGLAIWKETNYHFTYIEIMCNTELLKDLNKFQCKTLVINCLEGNILSENLFHGLITSNIESIDLNNFKLDEKYTDYGNLIALLYMLGKKKIKIRNSAVKPLEQFLIGLRSLTQNILFIDCE